MWDLVPLLLGKVLLDSCHRSLKPSPDPPPFGGCNFEGVKFFPLIQHERIIIIIIIGIVIFIVISELSLKYINVKIDYENSQEVRVPSPATATQ